jgi:L-malate glycosyltransferase
VFPNRSRPSNGNPLRRSRIGFFSLASDVYGGETMLLNLLAGLDRQRFDPIVIVPGTGRLSQALESLSVNFLVRDTTDVSRLSAPYQVLQAAAFLRRHKFDLVHMNSPVYWKPAELAAARLLGIPILTHAHIVIQKPSPFLHHSRVIVANSMFTRDASKAPADRIRVVYNSVDLARFDGARDRRVSLGVPSGHTTVLFIGQIKKIKGVEQYLDVAEALADRPATFLVAGDCRDDRYLAELRSRMAGQGNVRYLGFRADVADVFMSADVVLVPSEWDEPFGLVTIEAGACCRPVIATRVGGIPEVVRHGETGFLVNRGDLEALVSHTGMLIDDPELRARMGGEGRRLVEARFSNPVHVARMEAIYEELLKE